MEFFGYQTKDIKETLAQLTVLWATLGLTNSRSKDLREIMDYLTRRQSRPNTQYPDNPEVFTQKISKINKKLKVLLGETLATPYLVTNQKGMISSVGNSYIPLNSCIKELSRIFD